MTQHSLNRLQDSASPYLRSASHQPIDWHEWNDEAFARAKAEDKPILLDIGAVWCHWCHVIDRESYENAEIARIINEHFVAIKVDRDERPDVDSRYQSAISAISGQGGWPLTGFLLPDGKPFFGGTYFPPEDQMGRPGFRRVLLAVAESFKNKRPGLIRAAESLSDAVAQAETFTGAHGSFDAALVDSQIHSLTQLFDIRNGGFGKAPKFPLFFARPGFGGLPASRNPCSGWTRKWPPPAGHGRNHAGKMARGGCTISSAAAFIATPWTNAGWCHTSKKCRTTIPNF